MAKKIYKEVKQLNLPEIDKQILDFWLQHKVFEQSIATRKDAEPFVFYEGPPSANGMPGIHHVMSRALKDLFCRYKTLKGYKVERKGGWDTHGLPIELAVEKRLGIKKDDIGVSISVADYNAECRQEVLKYKEKWDDLTRKMGYWVDLDSPYITYENNYIESLWWILKQFYNKGYLYKGYTIQPYSPAAGTGLSSHELNLPGTYKNVRDTSATAQFKIITPPAPPSESGGVGSELRALAGSDEIFFLAWTTTPWTLPSNCALAVGAEIEYVLVKTFNPYTFLPVNVILAKELVGKYFKAENENVALENYKAGDKEIPYKIISAYKGKDLAGIRYEQLLPYVQPDNGDAFKVIVGDFVSTEDGTGIVHIAPSFGADDMRVGKQNGIGSLTLVNKQGKFVDEVTDFAGQYVKAEYYTDAEKDALTKEKGWKNFLSVDEQIAIKLKKENRAFKVEKYEHNYPHCWRTDKPILYYPLDSWFIKTTAVKDRLVELNKTINWKPESTGTGRFGNWLENLVDWNLSRSRYWGTPLPIWRTEDGSEEICIGSVEELMNEINKSISAGIMSEDVIMKEADPSFSTVSDSINHGEYFATLALKRTIDLHKPYVDQIILVSPTGKKMVREADLIDVWFDSGAMPYAQWHYPFENKEVFERSFPADFISEGVDQTRGWFFTLHAIGTLLKDSVAFKNVVSNGLVLDKNGNKMSKRLGNTVEPFETIAKYGADATRWYMITNAQPWDNLKFDINGIGEVQRKFFGTLFNTYSFFSLYANIDGFEFDEKNTVPVKNRPEIDRWIISKLHALIKEVESCYEDYEPTKAGRAIQEFVDEHLSNWYVRLCRRRFWKGEMNEDKKAAYETLYECLVVTAQLSSPIAPFFAEWLYKNLTDSDAGLNSVHLSNFPLAKEELIDESLNYSMQLAQEASSLILSLRKKANIRVRQPLSKALIPSQGETFEKSLKHVEDLIKSEVNVKQLDIVRDLDFAKKKVKANFRNLGKIFGKDVPKVVELLNAATQQQLNEAEKTGIFPLELEGKQYSLMSTEFEIQTEDIPGWEVAGSNLLTVALDITLTEDLKNEGNARELVNRIQNLRKDKDFNVTDRIRIKVEQNPLINTALNDFKNYICTEVLAEELTIEPQLTGADEVEVNENPVKLIIERKMN
jgi:isoleucyl-tRNA synthetase